MKSYMCNSAHQLKHNMFRYAGHTCALSFSLSSFFLRNTSGTIPMNSRSSRDAFVSPYRRELRSQEISAFTTSDSIFACPLFSPRLQLPFCTPTRDTRLIIMRIRSRRMTLARLQLAARRYFLESCADRASVEFAMGPKGIWVSIDPEDERFSTRWSFFHFVEISLVSTSKYKKKGNKQTQID